MPEQLTELWAQLPLTLFDLIVLVVVLLSALVALSRGIVREVFGLASWVGAFVVAWLGFAHVRPLAQEAMGNGLLADVVAAGGLFVVALIVLKLVTGIVAQGVDGRGFRGADRLGGLLFGVARGAFLVCAAWLAAGLVVKPEQVPPWVRQAWVLPQVEQGAQWLRGFLPPQLEASGRAAASQAVEGAAQSDAMRNLLGAPTAAQPEAPEYSPEQREQLERLVQPDQ
jgi:membrane protein required for colicin V production